MVEIVNYLIFPVSFIATLMRIHRLGGFGGNDALKKEGFVAATVNAILVNCDLI